MPFLSSSASFVRFAVTRQPDGPALRAAVERGLYEKRFPQVVPEDFEKVTGWASIEAPYAPVAVEFSPAYGAIYAFCMRVDQKTVPIKVLRRRMAEAMATESGGDGKALRGERKRLLIERLSAEIRRGVYATTDIYDVIWLVERSEVWFFGTQQALLADFESLFGSSFEASVAEMIPYQRLMVSAPNGAARELIANLQPERMG